MRICSLDEIQPPIISHLGEVVYEMIGLPEDHGHTLQHSLAYIVIPPGKSALAHYHRKSEETYYILKGSAKMVIDGQPFPLRPGQACLIHPGEIHQIFSNGEQDLEFLAISAPAWVPEDSFFD